MILSCLFADAERFRGYFTLNLEFKYRLVRVKKAVPAREKTLVV